MCLDKAKLLPPVQTPLGSVGLTAVEIAARLTSGPIIAGGIDFSFSVDAYHARSTPGHKTKLASLNRLRSPLNAHEAFRDGAFAAASKNGSAVRSDPAMRNYRQLFEEEFGSRRNVFELDSSGLRLGCGVLSLDEAVAMLSQKGVSSGACAAPADNHASSGDLIGFINSEKEKLLNLKKKLTGEAGNSAGIDDLLDSLDYLWAHFPECAGTGGSRPSGADLSFLKRVRAEIDPFLKLCDFALNSALI